jgi:hypothetical protein
LVPFALSASGILTNQDTAWLVVASAIVLTICAKVWAGFAARTRDVHLLALADAQDVMRMDSDKG